MALPVSNSARAAVAQEARARAYARFREGFRAYIAAEGGARPAAEGAFQEACEEATAAFAAASEQIRGFEAKLKEEGGQEGEVLAGLVRRLPHSITAPRRSRLQVDTSTARATEHFGVLLS